MNRVKVKAYAKLNLTLNIKGKKDGFHQLDSFVCTIDLYDKITVAKRKDKMIKVQMRGQGSEYIPLEKNNAYKGAQAFMQAFDTQGVDIIIDKNIPMGAGMGGSSADCSGVLRAMAQLYEIREEAKIKEVADSLGSDTGYLLKGGFARLRGRGEIVEPIANDKKLWFLLFLSSEGVSTKECYEKFDQLDEIKERKDTENCIQFFTKGKIRQCAEYFYNDLQVPAQEINIEVKEALEEAKSFSPLGYSMTGSGSGVFALFENESFCRWAESRYKGKNKTRICSSVNLIEEKEKWKNPFCL